MPIHPDYRDMLNNMIRQYGKKKGTAVFYATCKKRGWDYTKPRKKGKKKSVSTEISRELLRMRAGV